MNRKNLMLAMAAGAMASMMNDSFTIKMPYTMPRDFTPRFKKPETREEILSEPRTFQDSRQLREFSIKGHKVMAYSRKDAITRLKHQKKI